MRGTIHIAVLILLFTGRFTGQPIGVINSAEEIRRAVALVDRGAPSDARELLPGLLARYSSDPGTMYLQGRLALDGAEAAKLYQTVVDNYPGSEWADDALYRLYQYYQALGLYRTAAKKLDQLRSSYPSSPHVVASKAMVTDKEDRESNEPVQPANTSQAAGIPGQEMAPREGGDSRYVLQVGAFSTSVNAERRKNFLDQQGFQTQITTKVSGGKSLFLVWIYGFNSSEEAKRLGREIRAKYRIESFVVERF